MITKSIGDLAEVTKLAGFEYSKYFEYRDDGEIIALRGLNVKNGNLDLTNVKPNTAIEEDSGKIVFDNVSTNKFDPMFENPLNAKKFSPTKYS